MSESMETIETKHSEKTPAASSLLQAYMRDVERYPVLDKENEKKLTTEFEKTRGKDLRTKLILCNLRLVVKIAFEYRAAHHNLMDLIQEGNIGLIHGVEKFETVHGVPLANYTAKWIRAYMLRFIMNSARLVKVGTTEAQRKMFFNLSKEKAKLEAMGIEATDAKLADVLHVEEKELIEMKQRMSSSSEGSLSADEDDKHEVALDSQTVARPDALFEKEEFNFAFHALLDKFRQVLVDKHVEKKLIVFDHRFMKPEPDTFEAISLLPDMDVTRARVQQIDADLKQELRFFLRKAV